MQKIHLQINGEPTELSVPAQRLLIDVLRNDLDLTGTKEGCGIGVCGSCTVLRDGKMISSCLTLGVMCDGSEIATIEGLAKDGRLDPIQDAFIQYGGFQCGICTPGQIMAARALLNENPSPSDQDIREWMMGNLCRCTGYYKIIESISAASQEEAARQETGQ